MEGRYKVKSDVNIKHVLYVTWKLKNSNNIFFLYSCCCPIEILCEFCNDEVNNQMKVKKYSQKHTFEGNTPPINLRTKGDGVAEFIQLIKKYIFIIQTKDRFI